MLIDSYIDVFTYTLPCNLGLKDFLSRLLQLQMVKKDYQEVILWRWWYPHLQRLYLS